MLGAAAQSGTPSRQRLEVWGRGGEGAGAFHEKPFFDFLNNEHASLS